MAFDPEGEVIHDHQYAALDTNFIPSVAYAAPELAWAGLTQAQANDQGIARMASGFHPDNSGIPSTSIAQRI
ncbi:hypothetical protein [Octadecabacter sp. R77987]|uniref:hypothetical protein n=1 Tax=Octadecabacter sp. R77987 TaxID=3093874 RepID=UPI0036731358